MAKRKTAAPKTQPTAMADDGDWEMEHMAKQMCLQHPRVQAIHAKIKSDLQKVKQKHTKTRAAGKRK